MKSNSNAKHARCTSSEIPFLFCSCRNRHAAIELSACGMNIPLRNFDWRPEAAIRPAKSRSGAVAHTLMLLLMVQSTCHMEISLAWDLPRGHANHFGLVLCVLVKFHARKPSSLKNSLFPIEIFRKTDKILF